jgi:hypothetical protein
MDLPGHAQSSRDDEIRLPRLQKAAVLFGWSFLSSALSRGEPRNGGADHVLLEQATELSAHVKRLHKVARGAAL